MKKLLLAIGLVAAIVAPNLVAPNLAVAETLTVGAYPANPPWEAKTVEGTMEGFEVDLVKEIARRMGYEIDISDLGFQALFAATSSGRIDLAISTVSITPERLQSQSFTQPYYDSDLALAAPAVSSIASVEELKGKTVGALSTSTGETWIRENTEKYGFGEYKGYNTFQDLLLDIQAGRVEGGVSDLGGLQFAMQRMGGLKVVDTIRTGEQFAIMMAKDSPLLGKVNDAISAIKEDGTMAKIHETWLGVAPAPDSSTVTVKPIPTAN